MEPLKEPVIVRVRQLSQQILGRNNSMGQCPNLMNREGLLDALQVLYDECNSECLKTYDKNISGFVDKYRKLIWEVKRLRVNITDFEVKNVIGRGHFGEVHIVKERQTGDVYAMKTIKKYESSEQKSAAFEEERNIMATTRSPWLTSLQYAFQDNSNLYFIMEYHPGGDLLGLLYRQGGTLPESAATFYIAELILALNDLHSMGYVHRDVKPDNILLDRCGHLKLADFGSAARLNSDGAMADRSLPAGTPEYIAPEVLQVLDNKKSRKTAYGTPCDYWSVGILAYEITVGNTPFTGQNTTATYSKIINHSNNLKFPPDIILTQAYTSLIKGLLSDQNSRLDHDKILKHSLFKNVDFNGLREQVPPFVPNVTSVDDVSNFTDIQPKKNQPNIDNFKAKTKFSGKNLPFIGFTYTPNCSLGESREDLLANITLNPTVNDSIIENLQSENQELERKLMKAKDLIQEHESLKKSLDDRTRKVHGLEIVRDKLERDLAGNISEVSALKRTLDIERKERNTLENKALELIKSAKQKWELAEKVKVEALNAELQQHQEANMRLTTEVEILNDRLKHATQMEYKHQISLENVEKLSRRSVVGLESRLDKITSDSQMQVSKLQTLLTKERQEKASLQKKVCELENGRSELKEKLDGFEKKCGDAKRRLEEATESKKEVENRCSRLQEEKEKCRMEVKELNNRLKSAYVNKDEVEMLHRSLQIKQEDVSSFELTIQDLEKQLEKARDKETSSKKQQREKYGEKAKQLEDKIQGLSRDKLDLEVKLKEAELSDNNNKVKVKTLEDLLTRLESGVTKLENSSEREAVLNEQIDRLEQQLAELHESSALERQELAQLKSKLWRLDKDLSNADLDRKIVERDLKDSREETKKLNAEIAHLNMKIEEARKMHQSSILELSGINESMSLEITKLKKVAEHLEDKLMSESEKCDGERKTITDLRNEILSRESRIKSLEKVVKNLEMEKFHINGKLVESRVEQSNHQTELNQVKEHNTNLVGELQICKRDLENTQLNLNALREACTLLEGQLVEYESIHASYKEKSGALEKKLQDLLLELTKSKLENQDAKKWGNEEKTYRLIAETKCKRLEEEVLGYQKDLETYQKQCEEFKGYSNELAEELSAVEEKVGDYDVSLKSCERQMENYQAENRMLKEENSTQLTHLNGLKESNYKLNRCLVEAKNNSMVLIDRIGGLQNALEDKVNLFNEREIKMKATIQQQTKLIDYLQSKVEEGGKKKKTLSDKLFGSAKKENVPPISVVLNYRDLEVELSKEKEVNRNLRQEVVKLKADLNQQSLETLRNGAKVAMKEQKEVLDRLVQSPASQKSDLYRQNSLQRMHHNIPHMFESKLCTKPSKCDQCGNGVLLGRSASVCRECGVSVHPACASVVPRTCGLPQAFVKHYTDSLTRLTKQPESGGGNPIESKSGGSQVESVGRPEEIRLEGWVKVPIRGNTGWEKRYATLTPSTLNIYADKPSSPNMAPLEKLELCSQTGGKAILDPTPSEICVPVANSDLPFIIKVEVNPETTCWPPKFLVFMTLSVEDKQKWSTNLQSIFVGDNRKYSGETVIALKEDSEVNVVVDFENSKGDDSRKLLGTEKGLFSFNKGNLLHITGPDIVHAICLIPRVHQALLIIDETRILISCDLNHLDTLAQCAEVTKPTLKYKVIHVNNLNGFHILQASDFVKTKMAATATPKQLVLLKYDMGQQEFLPLRVLDTAEPTSCLLFAEQSLILGANKFFEIDLVNLEADEFLDASDAKLSHAVKCYKMNSFPVAVLRVCDDPIEYLMCFHEFAAFVDEYGRSSRNCDVKWSQIPLALHFERPYLYVVHFSSVEVFRLGLDSFNIGSELGHLPLGHLPLSNLPLNNVPLNNLPNDLVNLPTGSTFKVELANVRFLGPSKKGIYVKDGNDVKMIRASSLDADRLSLISESGESNKEDSDRFSFTSSMVQSLDGNLSDVSETDGDGEGNVPRSRKVKFAAEL